MLTGTCLCDDTGLAHLLGQQNLTDGVVDLVGTGVVQVLTFQIEFTTVLLTHSLGVVQGRGTSHIVLQQGVILAFEGLRLDDWQIGFLQVVHALVKNLWHIRTTKLSVKSLFVYLITFHFLYIFYLCCLT